MRTVLIHPFGNPNVYNAALALHQSGLLEHFHTCLFDPLGTRVRCHPELQRAKIHTHPVFEIARLAAARFLKGNWNGRSQKFVDFVGANCDRNASRRFPKGTEAIYGFEDFAFHSFSRAREIGLKTIYDLPIGFHRSARTLQREAADREPALSSFLQALHEPEEKLLRKDAEISLATQIICASSFTLSTIPESIRATIPVSVVPYGVDLDVPQKSWQAKDEHGPLKLLFVGRLDPRKGVHVIFRALSSLPPEVYELTLAGRWVPGFQDFLDSSFSVNYRYVGQLSREELPKLYAESDAFVFPSLFEGFGLVLLEAMAASLPVITTERTAGPDVVESGSGFIVKAGDVDALQQKLQYLLENRHALPEMGRIARKVAEKYTWQRYRQNLIAALIA